MWGVILERRDCLHRKYTIELHKGVLEQCLSQELKKVRHMSHPAEKGETQYHKAETHVSPS